MGKTKEVTFPASQHQETRVFMSSFTSLKSVLQEITLLIEFWFRHSGRTDQIPISLIKLIIQYFHLRDKFIAYSPPHFGAGVFQSNGSEWTICQKQAKLNDRLSPPWYRLFGDFSFALETGTTENIRMIKWTVQYRTNDQWKCLAIGIGDSSRAIRGPMATLYGETVELNHWAYGSFRTEIMKLNTWTFDDPITLIAEIRKGMEPKVFVHVILGDERICIGGTPILGDGKKCLYVEVHYGPNVFKTPNRFHALKLTNFRVVHGTRSI